MYDQLQSIEDRYEELGELLSDPEVISDTKRFMQLSKEEANTRDTVATYRRYKKVVEGISDTEELLGENLDADMAEMAKEELSDLKKEKEKKFEDTQTYLAVQKLYQNKTKKEPIYAVMPQVVISGPKLSRDY
ncbi:MAG: DUF1615 family protein, partial [Enterococcus sp.]